MRPARDQHPFHLVKQLVENEKAGEPLPSVDVALLRHAWSLFPVSRGQACADSISIFTEVGPVAFARCAAPKNLYWAGELAAWQKVEGDLEDFGFQQAATFQFSGDDSQRTGFLQHLRDKAGIR
jgi:hypothetical protein